MPFFHVILGFSQPPHWGWVEQIWWRGASEEAALAAGLALARARYTILGAGVSIYQVRVSVPNVPRAGLVSPEVIGQPLGQAAMPACAALNVRLLGDGHPPHRRSFSLRGMPIGSVFVERGQLRFASYFAPALNRWLALLASGPWQIASQHPVGPVLPILGVTEASPEEHDIFGGPLEAPPPGADPQFLWFGVEDLPVTGAASVRVWAMRVFPRVKKYARQVNGTRPVAGLFPNGFFTPGTLANVSSATGGKAQFYVQQFTPIGHYHPVGLVARKVGPARSARLIPPLALTASPALGLPPIQPTKVFVGPNPPSPVPPVNTYQTARDLVREVFEGYSDVPGSHQKTMGIAQASNQPVDTWVVFVPGVDVGSLTSNFGEWWSALAAYLGVDDAYTAWVEANIAATVPKNSKVFWVGHSLGGMSCQWARRNRGGISILGPVDLLTFGAPAFNPPYPQILLPGLGSNALGEIVQSVAAPRNARYFGYRLDPCTYLSPGGSYAWIRVINVGATGGSGALIDLMLGLTYFPWTTVLSPPPNILPNLFRLHMSYPNNPELDAWNWNGTSDAARALPPLITGPVKRFLYVP